MTDKPRRDPKDRPLRPDTRLSLAPLSVEEAVKAILQVPPMPKGDEPAEGKEKAPPKGCRKRTSESQDA